MYKFEPILKTLIWGSESWQLSGVPGSLSVVFEGPEKGRTLADLLCEQHERLVGRRSYERYGDTFPLLIKFIEANLPLSVQVHPNDELARKRHNSFGKTEMWYVLHAKKDAYLYAGFNQLLDPESYQRMVADGSITKALAKHTLQEGDVFFLPAGRVHSIGGGTTIAEIQQTSDITYRIYDFGRLDKNGNPRELHTELAKDAIDYQVLSDYRTHYLPCPNRPVELVNCDYFTTSLLDLNQPLHFDHSAMDSFAIYIGLEDNCEFTDAKGETALLHAGQTLLVPASNSTLDLRPVGTAKLLEVHI
ncbi:MAG: class I mannose-6-phosphate isomerase [Bacteroidaceae bacterium]|nr:class I mannose-6-phosphate isomerase [Bacteroidaceae bacterium]